MNKKIKKILSASLLMSSFLSISFVNDYSFGSKAVYASEYDAAEDGELKSLTLTKANGSQIDIIDRYMEEPLELTSSKSYYINLKSGVNSFYVNAEAAGDGYVTKIFTSASKSAEGYDSGKKVNAASASTFVYVRVYESEEAYNEAYKNGDVTNCTTSYKLSFSKKEAISEEEEDAEYAYLRGISLSNGEIQFSKEKTKYDVAVDEDVEEIEIKVKVENEDDIIEIQGKQLEDEDDNKVVVELKKGDNEIKINVESDDDEKTYTLNIYRGKKSSEESNVIIVPSNSSSEGWTNIGSRWMYNDVTGQPIKNQWHIDKNGVNYYLDEKGYMVTGWQKIQEKWYYFDASGAMLTGWNFIGNLWYYMDKSGSMKTGWFNDYDGKWYYLNSNGSMKTGWFMYNDKWYYLNCDGSMETESRIINGILYTFKFNGELV